MHLVRSAQYLRDYMIVVEFKDRTTKTVDLGPHLKGPIFRPLKDLRYFRSFTVNPDLDTVTWPNGADFAPDFLYEIGVAVARPPKGKKPKVRAVAR